MDGSLAGYGPCGCKGQAWLSDFTSGSSRVRASLVARLLKNLSANAGDADLIPGSGISPEKGNGKPLQYFLPGKSHGQRSLADSSPWGCKSQTRLNYYTMSRVRRTFIDLYLHFQTHTDRYRGTWSLCSSQSTQDFDKKHHKFYIHANFHTNLWTQNSTQKETLFLAINFRWEFSYPEEIVMVFSLGFNSSYPYDTFSIIY